VFFSAHIEVVNTKVVERELDLIRVVCDPNPLFKYQLLYRDGMATGVAGVYSFDEDWYYLYKEDTERYKVKRRKDLEGIPPPFTYKQPRSRRKEKPAKEKPLEQNAVAAPPALEEAPEQSDTIRMGGM
jgi:stage V sporulation protein G